MADKGGLTGNNTCITDMNCTEASECEYSRKQISNFIVIFLEFEKLMVRAM
jgi:hypothetical protein